MCIAHLESENLTMSAIAKAKILAHYESLPDDDKEKLNQILKFEGIQYNKYGASKFHER